MKTILIVEDDDAIRELFRELLEMEGYHVETAINGRQAVEKLEANDNTCLILLDLMMPEMSGWEFLKRRKGNSKFSTIPTVVCSASGIVPPEVEKDHCISKPFQFEDLMAHVRRYCRPG